MLNKINKVKIVCGDRQTLETRINELLPDYQPQGGLTWDGQVFSVLMAEYMSLETYISSNAETNDVLPMRGI